MRISVGNDVVTEARGIYDASKQTTRMQRLEEKRSRFLKAVKQAYLNLFQDHFLGSTHILALRVGQNNLILILSGLCARKIPHLWTDLSNRNYFREAYYDAQS